MYWWLVTDPKAIPNFHRYSQSISHHDHNSFNKMLDQNMLYFYSCWRRHMHDTVATKWLCVSDTIFEEALGFSKYILLLCLAVLHFYLYTQGDYLKTTKTKSVPIKSWKFKKYTGYLHVLLSAGLEKCFFMSRKPTIYY